MSEGATWPVLEKDAVDALRSRLLEQTLEQGGSNDSPQEVTQLLHKLVEEHAPLLSPEERECLVQKVVFETVGLGKLEPLMRDPEVEDVIVNGLEPVYTVRCGRVERTGLRFESDSELLNVIERILAPCGRRIDESSPMVDARLHDGSRVNCVIPPLSLSGPLLTIRRFRRRGFSPEELIDIGTVTAEIVGLLKAAVVGGANIVVSGGTGSGKTTTLNALSEFIPAEERVITIEDAAELKLRQPHVVRLESRPPNLEGQGEVTIRKLVRNALRMRPDRIIVGEVRGGEALDMLQAMNTGHDGSLTTLHANSAHDAIRRIETMALMADVDLPHMAVQQQVASAVDLVVHQIRDREGKRTVSTVAEVVRTAAVVGVRQIISYDGNSSKWHNELSQELAERIGEVG